jgi:hypothetical protein
MRRLAARFSVPGLAGIICRGTVARPAPPESCFWIRVCVGRCERMSVTAHGVLADIANLIAHPTLVGAVAHVVGLCSKEQVVGSYARGVVALVADRQAASNGAVRKFPRDTMHLRVAGVSNADVPISVLAQVASPYPARFSLDNPAPQSLCDGVTASLALGRVETHTRAVASLSLLYGLPVNVERTSTKVARYVSSITFRSHVIDFSTAVS